MLISRERSMLLVVDMQSALLRAIDGGEKVTARVCWLARAANALGVATLATEQYPQGLGPTDPAVIAALGGASVVGKVAFSCVAAGCVSDAQVAATSQVVICGIEAHVCVLQTAIELKAAGREVFLVADAVGSRATRDCETAIARCRDLGIQVVSAEMVAFEWLRKAGTDEFRAFSKNFLRAEPPAAV